jgi:dihydrofolate reductase
MGRKTYASIGRPLPNRRTIVLSRSTAEIPGVDVIADLGALAAMLPPDAELWICGGAEVYALTLPWWDELLLSRVKRTVEGDAVFPNFEHRMILSDELRDAKDFSLVRYKPAG